MIQLATGNFNELANLPRRKTLIRPLFEPLKSGYELTNMYLHCDRRTGLPDGDSDWENSDIAAADAAFNHLGTFAERNRKPPVASGHAATAVQNAMQAQAPAPEFKVGDLVECLNGGHPYCSPKYVGQTGTIHLFFSDGRAFIQGPSLYWPLRALRHAETEPRVEEGYYKGTHDSDGRYWHHHKILTRCVLHNSKGWSALGLATHLPSWLALKAKIEKEQ